ncbi:MAG TPA: peptidoglycan -binding protein [Rhodopila sp.]|nr:peptidoglycan -binding protein [Rhodopila sp.]
MAVRPRRNGGNGLDAWPGYVDALSTLLMVIIFVLLVFVLAQAFLTVALSGRSHELDKANQQLSALADALSLQKGKSAELQVSVSQLSRQLAANAAERDKLTAQMADTNLRVQAATVANTRLQSQLTTASGQANAAQAQLADAQSQLAEMKKQIADLDRTVSVDKDTLQAKLSDLATLTNQAKALAALRDELEQQAQNAAGRALTELQRREAVEAQLGDEKKLGDSARAQIALLNQQIEQLKDQLSAIAATLGVAQQQNKAKDVQIANLGQKLNVALAAKVEELQQYRSEFFGKLRTLLANRSGITIVGDRFVFQSEVLFPVGSADLTQAGVAQMTTLAVTIKDIATQIPPDLHWVLRVDGHTDPQPVKGGQFASNWELSAERAITVVKLLIADGVPADHLAATAFGEYQPFGPGDTPDAYAKDRRIELRLTDR